MMQINNHLHTAIIASIKAGQSIMDIYNTTFNIEQKEDNSPLTEADTSANTIINSYLVPTGIPIISEENKQTEYSTRHSWGSCWIVDPLDGTKEFIKRNGEFTVNIALIKKGKPELGVIYVPASKTLYFADVLLGRSFKVILKSYDFEINQIIDEAIELKPNKEDNVIRIVGSRSHMNDETLNFMKNLQEEGKKVEIVSKGSSLKFCLVAEGLADIYPRFAPTMEWDTAAGQAICNAIGIEVISKETNKPLLYNKENLLNPWFIVCKTN